MLDIGSLNGADARIDVRVGPVASLVIEADSNVLPLVQSEVSGNTLRIWSDANLRRSNDIHIIYTTPRLNKISMLSGGRLVASGFNGDDLTLVQHGSMKSELSGKVGRLDLANYGSGSINAAGLVSANSDAVQNGSGRIHLGQLRGAQLRERIALDNLKNQQDPWHPDAVAEHLLRGGLNWDERVARADTSTRD